MFFFSIVVLQPYFLVLQRNYRMVELTRLERVVSRDQVEQLKLILLCTLPVSFPPSFFKSLTNVSYGK